MKAYVMLAEGFEEIEALTVVDVLRRGYVDVMMISVHGEKSVSGAHHIKVETDKILSEIKVDAEDIIVLPGGLKGVQGLEASKELNQLLKAHQAQKGLLAAICAGPSFPGKLGFYEGIRVTSYPGFEKYLLGATPMDDLVVVDQNFVTSRGPATALAFSITLLSLLKGPEIADNIKNDMLFKD